VNSTAVSEHKQTEFHQ